MGRWDGIALALSCVELKVACSHVHTRSIQFCGCCSGCVIKLSAPRVARTARHTPHTARSSSVSELDFLLVVSGDSAVHVSAARLCCTSHQYRVDQSEASSGPAGSGSPPHYHMAAVNVLVYGRKRWTLLPPNDAVYGALPVREWHAAGGPEALRDQGHRVLECVQRPGDMLYVPDHWGHAVLNMEPSVGFATEVATARGHSMRLELRRASE